MSRQTPDYGLDCGRAVRAMFIVGVTAVIGIQAHKTLHQVVLTRVCACLVEQDGFELPVLFLKLRDDSP